MAPNDPALAASGPGTSASFGSAATSGSAWRLAGLATVEPGTAMPTAALWHHWPGSAALTLFTDQDPHQYLMRLLAHMRAGGCRPSAP